MSKLIALNNVVQYSKKRIKVDEVFLENFVSTDNILQNKTGISLATNLPPNGLAMPAYEKDNILIANIRPYLKKIWFSNKSGGCSSDVLVLETKKKYFPKFVYYNLFKDDFFEHVMNGSKGTKMPRGDKNQILNFLIPDFDIYQQQKIAKVLSDLDAKIELNNKINAALEAMAKTLYDYWFVQFDFPNANGKPYKSSGGKMIYNEELKREIPEGWEVKFLTEEMDLQYGFPFSTSLFNDNYEGVPVIRIRDILNCSISNYSTEKVDEKYKLHKGDILVGMDGNFHINYWNKENCYLNQRSLRIRSNEISISEMQARFSIEPYIKAREKNVSRTTVAHLSAKDVNDLKVLKATSNIQLQANKFFKSTLNKIISNSVENQELASFRDWLLPMLMNGQVSVGDVEEELSMVAEPSVEYKNN